MVVDDSSTDATPSILAEYADRITVVRTPQNFGNKSYAQEYGLQYVTGDVFISTDGDTILDRDDGVVDYDGDGTGNWRDLDSDADCRSDQVESGGVSPPRDTDGDTRPDFNDRDSDDDGLLDSAEDANCNGIPNDGCP